MVNMELKETNEGYVLHISRDELKHYLDGATNSFIRGKSKIIFPVEYSDITELVVYEERI